MSSRVIHFLRPTFIVLIALALLAGVANLTLLRSAGDPDFIGVDGLLPSDLANLDLSRVVLPRPDLDPAEVVELQLTGLGDQQADGVGILQCFCLASPGNRAVTGPLERFGQMVRQDPYDCMANPRALLIGRPQYEDRVARLLVTVIDDQSRVRAFTFVLSRQLDPPFKDCWMTEAVLSALPTPPPEPSPVPSA